MEPSSGEIYEVIRGNPMNEITAVGRWWTLIHKKQIVEEHKQKEIDSLTNKIKEMKGNYGGIYYSNHFKVDHDINLVDFGFLGPFNDEKSSSYSVHIELYESIKPKLPKPYSSSCYRMAKHCQNIIIEKGENFYVGFQKPIPIKAKKWYLIQFMLEGPDTWRCANTVTSSKVFVGNSNVIFDFTIGSKQMRSIRFTVSQKVFV